MTLFSVLADNLPADIDNALAGPIYAVKGLESDGGIFRIHKFREIAVPDLFCRISENAAEGIVEKFEISVQIDFVKTIRHFLNEHPIAIFADFRFFFLRIRIVFILHQSRSADLGVMILFSGSHRS